MIQSRLGSVSTAGSRTTPSKGGDGFSIVSLDSALITTMTDAQDDHDVEMALSGSKCRS